MLRAAGPPRTSRFEARGAAGRCDHFFLGAGAGALGAGLGAGALGAGAGLAVGAGLGAGVGFVPGTGAVGG